MKPRIPKMNPRVFHCSLRLVKLPLLFHFEVTKFAQTANLCQNSLAKRALDSLINSPTKPTPLSHRIKWLPLAARYSKIDTTHLLERGQSMKMINHFMIALLLLGSTTHAIGKPDYQCMRKPQDKLDKNAIISQLGWPELTIYDPNEAFFHLKDLSLKMAKDALTLEFSIINDNSIKQEGFLYLVAQNEDQSQIIASPEKIKVNNRGRVENSDQGKTFSVQRFVRKKLKL